MTCPERRRGLIVALNALTVACGANAESDARLQEMRIREAAVVAARVAIPSGISPENDGFGFALAMDLRVSGSSLAVLENGNSRIVVFDSLFRAIRTIGRDGAGPGELRGAFSMDAGPGFYAVAEINNARISIFDTSGVFQRSLGAPGDAAFAFGPDGVLYMASGSVDHYLSRVDPEGLRQPFGDRPLHLYPVPVQRDRVPPGVGRELVAVGPAGDVFVFDRALAGLVRFGSDGARRGLTVLPSALREGLLEHQRRVYADFGDRRPVYEVAAGDLTVTDSGRLLLLFPAVERTFGLLIDPDGGLATRLEWSEGSEEAARGAAGGFGVLEGSRLYRGLGDEVTVYQLGAAR